MIGSLQTEMAKTDRGRIVACDSAYHVVPENRDRDIVVNASYCGVLPARFLGAEAPRGIIGVDCGVGPGGASIAGLWYLEALNMPAAVADVMTVELGNGVDLYNRGVVSFVNRPAADCGVRPGMPVSVAAEMMLANDPGEPAAAQVTNRALVDVGTNGRKIICTDSIAFGLPEDADNVLVTAGHTGRSAVPYLLSIAPHGFICSDGGGGRDGSGRAGLEIVEAEGLAGATVDARLAAMGDGLSSYRDGIITGANKLARAAGVELGMSAREAARLLADRSKD
ncbi:hypothetical protein EKN06_09845 [Croceicoccus ponticola]|uniref:Uncharacterized protein n=1 Tax=Croceicoccus ponticola TaxID=2217664 RepID=A0A437GW60_9SPHN|nr:hypothetical protein [Croceicoccus ponticola]RVQ66334.1 hypothetical protein EKN06_09845 [Croceicoccus ponticola]